jgi:undecaprenyl-diphosphatase
MVDVLPGLAEPTGRLDIMAFTFAIPFSSTLIGLILTIIGLSYQKPFVRGWDINFFLKLHMGLRPYVGFFRYIWPLGTVPVGLTLLLILFIPDVRIGLIAVLTYVLIAVVEQLIKRRTNRTRPFEILPGVLMSQPKTPSDRSHPSGDSMRVWFLAIIFPLAFSLHGLVFILTTLMATTLSIGRIVMGVHYPLDVMGGTGLGLLAAGISIFSYQLIFNLGF